MTWLEELWLFGLEQAYACLFGGFLLLVAAIYFNFFSHHYLPDASWILLLLTVFLFWKTTIYFKVVKTLRHMPLLLGWFMVALFIWIAENVANYANIWIYPNQSLEWQLVSISKLFSWYMLMLLSFVLITIINDVCMRNTVEKMQAEPIESESSD